MSKVCKECGHQMDDNVQVCPNCGCPVENASASAFMDKDVLNQGKSTEAESIISGVAASILKWGNILSVIVPICTIFMSIAAIGMAREGGEVAIIVIGYIIEAVIYYFLIRLIAKLIWGVIMLFVNMSTTLKRIEIKLEEQNGTH